jgi:outer membrane immunogenic protein
MKRRIVAGARIVVGALFIAAAAQAWAADLPEPAPPPPRAPASYMPVVATVYNWGGLYYGVNGGYGFGTSNWTQGAVSTGNFNTSGFTAGATVGANLQADAFVFGIDGDFDAMGIKGSTNVCGGAACQTEDTWLATIRARVGYAVDRVLIYGTAGGAFGNVMANSAASTSFQSETKAGWTAGAGVEAALADNWTARIEYLFVDLQNGSFNTAGGPISVKFDASLIRVGVDYKFR